MDPLAALFLLLLLVAVVAFAIVVIGISSTTSAPRRVQTVTLYAGDGSVIHVWEGVSDADPAWTNSRVAFTDPVTKQPVVLKGTIVVEELGHSHSVDRAQEPNHIVRLYALNGEPIRTWRAIKVDPAWSNDRTVLLDIDSGKAVAVFGTTVILKASADVLVQKA